MRPYWAIIVDSYREATSSRVLWLVLAVITLALLAIFPFSYRETLSNGLRPDEVDWDAYVAKILSAKGGAKQTPGKQLWDLMAEDQRTRLSSYTPLPGKADFNKRREYEESVNQLLSDLTGLMKRVDFYSEAAWSGLNLTGEGRDLLQRKEQGLAEAELKRLNRILLEVGFPRLVAESERTSLQFRYSGLYGDFGPQVPITVKQLKQWIFTSNAEQLGLPYVIDKFVLSIGTLIAILVTAPIIPQTFDPGSLHLLLSKPLYRSLIYLTKFLGGCMFVLLSASYLFIGLWLYMGLRLGLWEGRLLWCIPIYTFVFAIYYSVAALAGLYWRNTVVSIFVAILFWATCFVVGTGQKWMAHSSAGAKLEQVIPAGKNLLAVDHSNTPLIWNQGLKTWEVCFLTKDMADARWFRTAVAELPDMVGPIYDAKHSQVVAITKQGWGREHLTSTKAENNWQPLVGGAVNNSPTQFLIEPEGSMLLVGEDGLQRLDETLKGPDPRLKGLEIFSSLMASNPLKPASPPLTEPWRDPAAASDSQAQAVFVYSRGVLERWSKQAPTDTKKRRKPSDKYHLEKQVELADNLGERGDVAAAQGTLLIACQRGEVLVLNQQSLEVEWTFPLANQAKPRALLADPTGNLFYLLASDGYLWVYDHPKHAVRRAAVSGQGDISGIAQSMEGSLLVIDRGQRVTQYAASTQKVEQKWAPALSISEMVYRRVVLPVYTLFPKPGEFYRIVGHLLTPEKEPAKAKAAGSRQGVTEIKSKPQGRGERIRQRLREINAEEKVSVQSPWQPVWSSALFIAVMLVAGCVYIQWQEF